MFYLDNIFNSKMNQEERIIAILKARGFLIDEIDGHYYMSDNASVEDVEYLKIGFDKYSLGQIKNSNVYKKSSRRSWDKSCLSRSYVYNSIIPQTTEVIISDRVSEGDAIMFFHSLNRNRSEAGPTERSWQEFSWERLGSKACVSRLESYVAYYVKAVSSCGVYTCYSCDGNHENGGKIYIYSDYPSNIWHEYLWKYIVCYYFGDIPFIEKGIEFVDNNSQKDVYQLVNQIADFLYSNRMAIRSIKKETLQNFSSRFLHRKNNEEIEKYYRAECERILSSQSFVGKIIYRK